MTVYSNELREGDIDQLARLHIECLPNSHIVRFGYYYVKSFYRYINCSPQEFVFFCRDTKDIISACVLSMSPKTLNKRLIKKTPLILWAPLMLFNLPIFKTVKTLLKSRSSILNNNGKEDSEKDEAPEIILMFTSHNARSRGLGASILGKCESFLLAQSKYRYITNTLDDNTNRASSFYTKNGFTVCYKFSKYGKNFQLLEKKLVK